ncbi:MAG: hypothetical protein ISR77_06080 [Pirellulaceae bacterium]|nr:hypothetical protein [Pirellulaceae bacterium]
MTLNGQPVRELQPKAKELLTAPLDPDHLIPGRNHASLRLDRRSANSTKPRTLTALEIDAVFPEAE